MELRDFDPERTNTRTALESGHMDSEGARQWLIVFE